MALINVLVIKALRHGFLATVITTASVNICHAQNAAWSGFISGALESINQSLARQIEEERQQKLLEQQYEQQKKLLEYQYQLEAQKRDREAAERQRRVDEQRRIAQAAEEQKKKEEAEQRRNATSTGTGFFVASNGYLVTNSHVIEGSSHFAIRDISGNFYRAEVVAQDSKRDLALLRTYGTFPTIKIAKSDSVSKGQRVMAVGYPQVAIQGNESKVTDGVISSFSGMNNDTNWFQISTPIQGGNSGGPLVTESGHAVGVVVATANAMRFFKNTGNIPQNVNYAIKSNVLLDFLSEQRVSLAGPSIAKTSIDAVDRATVLVIAKNSPLSLNFTVSPEQKAIQAKEAKEAKALEDARLAQEAKLLEQQRIAEAATEATRQLEEQQKLASEEAQKQRQNQALLNIHPDWDEIKNSNLFYRWVERDWKRKVILNSRKVTEIAELIQQFKVSQQKPK
jgi:S1-C subfamily serine protease